MSRTPWRRDAAAASAQAAELSVEQFVAALQGLRRGLGEVDRELRLLHEVCRVDASTEGGGGGRDAVAARRRLRDTIAQFSTRAHAEVAEVTAELAQADSRFQAVVKYFGDDPITVRHLAAAAAAAADDDDDDDDVH